MRQPWVTYRIHDERTDETTTVAFDHKLTATQRTKLVSYLRTARDGGSFVKPNSLVTWAVQQLESSAPIDGRVLTPASDDVVTF